MQKVFVFQTNNINEKTCLSAFLILLIFNFYNLVLIKKEFKKIQISIYISDSSCWKRIRKYLIKRTIIFFFKSTLFVAFFYFHFLSICHVINYIIVSQYNQLSALKYDYEDLKNKTRQVQNICTEHQIYLLYHRLFKSNNQQENCIIIKNKAQCQNLVHNISVLN